MTVEINGEPTTIPGGLDVAGMLGHLGLDPRMVVVERNRHILRREDLGDVTVASGDRYELVHFVGGG